MKMLLAALVFGVGIVSATAYGIHLIKSNATAKCEARFNEQKMREHERVAEIYSRPSRTKLELIKFLRKKHD